MVPKTRLGALAPYLKTSIKVTPLRFPDGRMRLSIDVPPLTALALDFALIGAAYVAENWNKPASPSRGDLRLLGAKRPHVIVEEKPRVGLEMFGAEWV